MAQHYLIERVAFGGEDPLVELDVYVAIYQDGGREMLAIIDCPSPDPKRPLAYVFGWFCPDGDADR